MPNRPSQNALRRFKKPLPFVNLDAPEIVLEEVANGSWAVGYVGRASLGAILVHCGGRHGETELLKTPAQS